MKQIFTFLLSGLFVLNAHAQWSNTTNQFYDSLDMPVCRQTNDQKNPLIIKSQSDGGYFIIWEDYRSDPNLADIYAQKYDNSGKALWATDGVPVAAGASSQTYSDIPVGGGSNGEKDYRNVSHTADDGAGGFYIAWHDYVRLGSYDFRRVCVQHVLSNGSRVFADAGYVVGNPNASANIECSGPQLITDGMGGFFIGYSEGPLQGSGSHMNVMVYGYKDAGGTLKQYGGNVMNAYDVEHEADGPCGTKYWVDAPGSVFGTSFVIFPDLQNGCGVAMTQQLNTQQNIIGFNQLCRVKKDCHTLVRRRGVTSDDPGASQLYEYDYKKDSVVRLYSLALQSYTVSCHPVSDPNSVVVYTNILVENGGEGLLPLTPSVYGFTCINGTMLPTDGNINAALITWNQRDYINSSLTNWVTRSITFAREKYDSLPYQLCTDTTDPYYAYKPEPDDKVLDKLNTAGIGALDTLIAGNPNYYYGYTFANSGNRVLLVTPAMSQVGTSGSTNPLFYQELILSRQSADSFALNISTPSKYGIVIGQEVLTNNTGTSITYAGNPPAITGDGKGNALFYVGNYHNYIQVSPAGAGGNLWWGAMGTPISTGIWNGRYTDPDAPFAYMDDGGKAVIAWQDGRQTPGGYSGLNIYMRHLDSLTVPSYQPPLRKVQLLGPANGSSGSAAGVPQVLNGTSNAWTVFQTPVYDPAVGVSSYTPTAAIKDDYSLGDVSIQTYENGGAIRTDANGKPYLNRNYTITVTNHPANATIYVRLIFTASEFKALQAADPSIHDPGDLSVIKQPNTGGNVPATYTPVAGELGLAPTAWAAIDTSGYYIEVAIKDFSNFFIVKGGVALPVTLLSFTAKAIGTTGLLQWQTATETNNSHFDILRSADGKTFNSIGRVEGHGTTTNIETYSFTDAAPINGMNYYRLAQVDLDGKVQYSDIRLLTFGNQLAGVLRASPNPVKGILHVQLPQAASGQGAAQLYDVSGHKVLQQIVPAGTLQLDIDVSTLMPGIYILHYDGKSIKVVKE